MDKREYIIAYVEHQIGLNLEQYRTDFSREWERPDEIIVEYREIPKFRWRMVEELAAKKNARIFLEHVGVWGMMIGCRE